MGEFFMGQELIQGELPANSPKPAETPPEGVIMTDASRDGYTRRYIYISMAGSAPEEITISEGYQKKRVSGAAVAVENVPYEMEGSGPILPDGVVMPEGAVLPEGAVFSGLPSESRTPVAPTMGTRLKLPAPQMGTGVPLVARHSPAPQSQPTFQTNMQVAPPMAVPTMTIQKAAPQAPVLVHTPQAPQPGVEVQVPFMQTPIDKTPDMSSGVRLSNSLEGLKPVTAQSVADGPRVAPQERPVQMLGSIARPLPLTTQEGRKDSYPVSNPIAPAVPAGGMSQINSPSGFGQNQIPLRHLGQAAPAAPAAPATPATPVTTTPAKCPGAVEMPDGTTIEPDHYITLAALCELMPFLVSTLTDIQSKGLAPGQKVPVVGQNPNGQTAVPTGASFGPAGQGPYGRSTGGWVGGGGGGPGPAGNQGPIGQRGLTGPGSITEPPVVKVDGNFTAGPGAFVPVPGTTVPFSMAAPGVAEVKAIVTLGDGATQNCESVQIGIRINGTDYPLTVRLIQTMVLGVSEFHIGQCFNFPITLPAGNYTADLLIRGLLPGEFGGGLGAPASVNANPSIPLIMTVTHSS